MEWDRRTFVKFAVGGVLGFASSPFILKMQDDTAIWTQNWNWVPTPENGELSFANSVNPATGTGVRARIIKGRLEGQRLIKVEGNPDHPLCRGGVIPEDAAAAQQMYNGLMRVDAPIIRETRTGLRGRVGADQALTVLAKKLAALKEAGQAHTVAVIGDDPQSLTGELLMRFMAAYGSPNLAFTPSADQHLALAGRLLFGQAGIGFDLDNADCVVSFGSPLLEGFGAPVAVRKAFAAWQEKGARFIQVEPRASVTASKADDWLACKPGMEGLLALGLAAILVKGGATGLNQMPWAGAFKEMLAAECGLDRVAQVTGVPVEKLNKAAKALASAKRPVAVCGPGASGDPGSLHDFLAVLALNAVCDNLGKPGGLVIRQDAPLKPLGEPLAAPSAPALPGADTALYNVQALAEAALEGKPYKLGALIVVGNNPVYAGPQASLMKELCEAVPLLVSINDYMDETASMADIVLPTASFLECWGDCGSSYGAAQGSYGLHRPLVTAFPQAKSAGDWILGLAKKLGGSAAAALPFKNAEEALKARTAGLGDFEELAAKSYWVQEKPAYGQFNVQQLVISQARQDLGENSSAVLKSHKPPAAATAMDKHRPLLLAAAPSLRTGAGDDPMSPYQIKMLDQTMLVHKDQMVVEINPKTAAKLHVAEGDAIEIVSAAGKLQARAHLFAGAAPDMVFAPLGLGHTAFGMYLKDKGDNFFQAVEVAADPLSGLPQWGLTPVSVRKAGGVSHV